MICPRCGDGRAVVKDTRDVDSGEVKRFRKCDKCGYSYSEFHENTEEDDDTDSDEDENGSDEDQESDDEDTCNE